MTRSVGITRAIVCHLAQHLRGVATLSAFLLFMAAPLSAQGFMDRLKSAAKKIGAVSAELLLASATSIDVEKLGLATVQVGGLTFGVAGLDIKDTTAMRVRAYLYNPTEAEVRVPLMREEMFTLVDTKGRRIELLAPPKIKGLARGAPDILVAPLERVEIALLFGQMKSDAGGAVLKVGSSGIIHGLPVIADATATQDPSVVPPPQSSVNPSPLPRMPTAAGESNLNTPTESASVQAGQGYTIGDKVEAYVLYSWQKATVVRVILNSRYSNYEVAVERTDGRTGPGISNFEVSKDNVRQYRETERLAPRGTTGGEEPRLGNYSIYSYGATSTTPLYIGHVRLEEGGVYRVSRSSSGEYFGAGRYSFDAATSTVRWLSGPFKNNGWGGKFEILQGGKGHRLELTARTIGTNYGEN